MSPSFHIPCTCGRQLAVTPKMAGEVRRCECGNAVEIPTLRVLKRLPIAPEAADRSTPEWSFTQGALFNGGLIMFLAAAFVIAYGMFHRSRLVLDKPELDLRQFTQDLNSVTPARAFEEWKAVSNFSLDERRTPGYLIAREIAQTIFRWNIAAAILGTAGLALMVFSFLSRPPG